MQFIEALGRRFQSSGAELRRLHAAGQYVMRHVGLVGRVRCLATRDGDGRPGVLMVIDTPQQVPGAARDEIQLYFRRKLAELGELNGRRFQLLIRDAEDQSLAHRARADSSSARVASIIAAANHRDADDAPSTQLADLRTSVRQRMHDRRQARPDSDYAPLTPAPLTDIGVLA